MELGLVKRRAWGCLRVWMSVRRAVSREEVVV